MAVYLYYGEEAYLIENKVKKIKKEFGELVQGINYLQIDDTNVEQLIDDLETPAFGFAKKLIIAKNTRLFKKEKNTATKTKVPKGENKKKKGETEKNTSLQEKIANYIENNQKELNETVELVFVEQEIEKTDPLETTPIEALNILYKLKKEVNKN